MPNTLPVMEMFSSIQGEGYFQGHSAFFIRLAGCNVGCTWCDVKESWDEKLHPAFDIETIVHEVKEAAIPVVIITGGEPLMHDCTILTQKLKNVGFNTHLETSGTYPITGKWDWICLSPKKFKPPLTENLLFAHELKVVIYHPSDFLWAEKYAQLVTPTCKLFLQPEWGKEKQLLPLITDYIQSHPQWVLSLQIHKYMNMR